MTFLKGSTGLMTGILRDELGAVVPLASLTALTITLTDIDTGQIINTRNAQNALNTNNVTVDSGGNLAWTLQPADNVIITATTELERHRVKFEWAWSLGTKAGKHIEDFQVENE